jgi:hypothetical protein
MYNIKIDKSPRTKVALLGELLEGLKLWARFVHKKFVVQKQDLLNSIHKNPKKEKILRQIKEKNIPDEIFFSLDECTLLNWDSN